MQLHINVKPFKITGNGTLRDAKDRFRSSVRGLTYVYSNRFGNAYVDGLFNHDAHNVYAYNIEVFKRGKYRKNKQFVIYRYTFPIDLFDYLNMEIRQGSRTFKIVQRNNI